MGLLILIIIILIFLFWYNRPPELNGVVLFFANIGSGKTTLLSKIAIQEQRKIQKGKSKYKYIISNAHIHGCSYVTDIRGLLQRGALQDCLILLDEGSIIYNNRKNTMKDKEIQFFKLIRHYRCTCVVVSQSHEDIDITLRRLYTQIYLLNKIFCFTLIRPIKKMVGIDEISHQIIDKYRFTIFFSYSIFFRPLYYKLFNSWWIPSDIPLIDPEQLEIIDALPQEEPDTELVIN